MGVWVPDTLSLLPYNATAQERALEGATARLSGVPLAVRESWDPATCPAHLLPWLAWALSVDEWSDTWTEAQKRAVIMASYRVHHRKGTVGAVRDVLVASGADVSLKEWWQEIPKGTPHTFSLVVELEGVGMGEGALDLIERQVTSVKPVRSHFTTKLFARTRAAEYWGFAVFSGETTEVLPYAITEIEAFAIPHRWGFGLQSWDTTTVYPQ